MLAMLGCRQALETPSRKTSATLQTKAHRVSQHAWQESQTRGLSCSYTPDSLHSGKPATYALHSKPTRCELHRLTAKPAGCRSISDPPRNSWARPSSGTSLQAMPWPGRGLRQHSKDRVCSGLSRRLFDTEACRKLTSTTWFHEYAVR